MDRVTQDEKSSCPRCHTTLPPERRSFPWCECGWNLPADPVEKLRGWRQLLGRITRRIGAFQARRDVAWLGHESPHRRLDWYLMTAVVFTLALVSVLIRVGLFVALLWCVVLAIRVWQYNRIAAAILLLIIAAIVYLRSPRLSWLARRNRSPIQIVHERVLGAVVDVAKRLDVDPPHTVAFTLLPSMGVTRRVRWTLPPRLERVMVVGLPVLAVLNVSEFKAIVGHVLVCMDGAKVWFLSATERMLHWCWNALRWIVDASRGMMIRMILSLAPILLCVFVGGVLDNYVDKPPPILGAVLLLIKSVVIPLLTVLLVVGTILWLIALWYRRWILLADRVVAEAYGRNVLLRAIPKLWAARRTFGQQWASMLDQVQWAPAQANLYRQFRDGWANLPSAYKEKAYREVTVGFRSLLYFRPTFQDRVASLAQFPNKLFDDRPAAQLLPRITELGADMTNDMWKRSRPRKILAWVTSLLGLNRLTMTRALAALLKRRYKNAFVVFEERLSGKFVQFAGSEKGTLLLDIPQQALDEEEITRAKQLFDNLGIDNPVELDQIDPKTKKVVGKRIAFRMALGKDVKLAADVTVRVFAQVYRFPNNFELVISKN